MLAAVRRGPGSPPTNDEMIEYLIARKRHDQERPPAENYSFEHVCGWEKKHRLGGASGASPWMVTLALRLRPRFSPTSAESMR